MRRGLEVTALTKSFDRRVVIDSLNLSVTLNSLRCIVGPNASGKSTLLSLIGGQLASDSGEVRVGGRVVSHLSPEKRRWCGISRSFQMPCLMSTLTVREHMFLATRQGHSLARALLQRAKRENVDFPASWHLLGLVDVGDVTVSALSHAQRKLLDIAIAIETSPVVLLLDEPTSGLDERSTELVREAIRECARSAAVVIVEHNLSFIDLLNCPVSFLYRGKIVRTGTLDEVRSDPLTKDVYLHAQKFHTFDP